MFAYRFGRLLQILALIDCGIALFFPNLGGMETQLQIVLLAGVLFIAGRYFQKKGETALRASGQIPPLSDAGESSSPSAGGSGGNP
jgi:hypothetical protein